LRAKRQDRSETGPRARRGPFGHRRSARGTGRILAARSEKQRRGIWTRGKASDTVDGQIFDRCRSRIGRRRRCDCRRHLSCDPLPFGDEGGAMKRSAPLLVCFACSVFGADPRIVYTKSFPGSVPAYVEIAVEKSGAVSYKEAVDDDPETFTLNPATASE